MGSYSKHQRGNATVITIAALLLVGFIGTALIKMSRHDVIGGTDYYSATKARVAAKAGLQKFEHIVDNLPDSVITVMYKMVIDTFKTRWVVGNGTTFESLNDNSEYRVQAVGVDPENFVLHVRADGRSGASSTSIHAYYKMGNLELRREATVDQDFALYIGDVASFLMIGPIDIDGNTRMSGKINFDQNASGSRFRGVYRTSEETNTQRWQGTYIFDTLAYFGTSVRFDGGAKMIFNDLSAFEVRPSSAAGSDSVIFHDNTYFNKNGTGGVVFDMNFHNIHHTSAFNFNSGTWLDTGTQFMSPQNPMDIADSVGLSRNICMPDIDVSKIPAGSIYNWSTIKNGRDNTNSPLEYYPGWNELDGKMANEFWEEAYDQNKLWRGFAVLRVDDQFIMTKGGGDIFTKKLIIIVSNGRTLMSDGAGDMFQTSPTANLVLYGAPGSAMQNIGDWTLARGYIYADSGATLNMGGNSANFDPFIGAIHVQDNARMQWYPAIAGVPTITYDAEVIEDLRYDDFLTFPCAAGSNVTNDSIVFVDGFGIDDRLLGINY